MDGAKKKRSRKEAEPEGAGSADGAVAKRGRANSGPRLLLRVDGEVDKLRVLPRLPAGTSIAELCQHATRHVAHPCLI